MVDIKVDGVVTVNAVSNHYKFETVELTAVVVIIISSADCRKQLQQLAWIAYRAWPKHAFLVAHYRLGA